MIGGGPAGSVTAIGLARRGWSLQLVDARPLGGAKCCGHCLHPGAFDLLRALSLERVVRSIALASTPRGRVLLPGDRILFDEVFDDGGAVVTRAALDAALIAAAQAAGVVVRQPATARVAADGSVEVHERGHRVSCRPTLIVGADGLGSGVARAASLVDRSRTGRKFGFACDVERSTSARGYGISMHVAGGGYLGVVQETDESAHLAGLLPSGSDAPTRPRDAMRWFAERFPSLRALGPIVGPVTAAGPMPWRTTGRTTDRVALVGDAAGYVEPFTGEGMMWAIQSALLLVDAVGDGAFDAAARGRYESAWQEHVERRLRRCALVAGIVERPRALRTVAALRVVVPAVLARRALRKLVPR